MMRPRRLSLPLQPGRPARDFPATVPSGADLPADPQGQLLTGLARVGSAFRIEGWRNARDREITPTQVQILLHLRARGRSRLADVASGVGITQPTASVAASTLVTKRLVSRTPDPDDRRRCWMALTGIGRMAADRHTIWPESLASAVEALTPSDQAAMLRILGQILRTLENRGEVPVSRMCPTCRHFRSNPRPGEAERPHLCARFDTAFGDRALRLDCAAHQPAA